MIAIKYEHVPGSAWRVLAVVGESRFQCGASWPISQPVYTLAQAQVAASNIGRQIRGLATHDQVALMRNEHEMTHV